MSEKQSASIGREYPFVLSRDTIRTAQDKATAALSSNIERHLEANPPEAEAREDGRIPSILFNIPVLVEDGSPEGVKAAHLLLPEILAGVSHAADNEGFIVLTLKPIHYSVSDAIEHEVQIEQETYGYDRVIGWSLTLVHWDHLKDKALELDEDGDPHYAFWWVRAFADEVRQHSFPDRLLQALRQGRDIKDLQE